MTDNAVTYNEANVADKIDRMLSDAGLPQQLDRRQIHRLDQFHAGGADAVDKVIESLHLDGGTQVLDVGSGFGGPARQLADQTGATVVGIDITRNYVDAANALTKRCGLDDRVTFEHTDLADLADDRVFDAALTMHVQMNVANKQAWFSTIADHLSVGATLGVWEICTVDHDDDIAWPMPWSIDGTDSHLVTPDELRADIAAAGFVVDEWIDETSWTNDWFTNSAGQPPNGPALPMLLDDGLTRILNLAVALSEGTLAVVRGQFHKPGPTS